MKLFDRLYTKVQPILDQLYEIDQSIEANDLRAQEDETYDPETDNQELHAQRAALETKAFLKDKTDFDKASSDKDKLFEAQNKRFAAEENQRRQAELAEAAAEAQRQLLESLFTRKLREAVVNDENATEEEKQEAQAELD